MKYLTLLVLFVGLYACQPSATTTTKEGPSLLYQITKEGQAPSYLYGTLHLLPKKDIALSDTRLTYLEKAEQLALEMDLSDPKLQQAILSAMQVPADSSLRVLLDSVEYAFVDSAFYATTNIKLDFFEQKSPLMTSTVLLPTFLDAPAGSYEAYLMEKATDKPIRGLETVDEAVSAMRGISLKEQTEGLVDMLRNPEKSKTQFLTLIRMYKNEQIDSLQHFMKEVMQEMPSLQVQLLKVRNLRWLPRMQTMMAEKSTFFAVGAAHLHGEDGLLRLLEEKGYQVQAL